MKYALGILIASATPVLAHDASLPHTHDLSMTPVWMACAAIVIAGVAGLIRKGTQQ